MKVICAECKKHISDIPSEHDGEPVERVSHGICVACAKELYGLDLDPATGKVLQLAEAGKGGGL